MTSPTSIIAVICFSWPAIVYAQRAELPAPSAFTAGDTWEWRQVDTRTKAEDGKLTRTTVQVDDKLFFRYSSATSDFEVSRSILGFPLSTPAIVWPLEVGRKWVVNGDWSEPGGRNGNTKQDAEVTAYEEVTVPAGTFMAFKIEYRGWCSVGGGRSFSQDDTFWYAPEAYVGVKQVHDAGRNNYTRELVSYKRGSP